MQIMSVGTNKAAWFFSSLIIFTSLGAATADSYADYSAPSAPLITETASVQRSNDILNWLSKPYMEWITAYAVVGLICVLSWLIIYTGGVFGDGVPGVGGRSSLDVDDVTHFIWSSINRWSANNEISKPMID